MYVRKHRLQSFSLPLFLLAILAISIPSAAQTTAPNEWTWVGGSDMGGQPGVYGLLGAPATGNIPGCRDSSASSTDSSGNLWLFGGEGCTATGEFVWLNDLWEFSPSTSEWTWWSGGRTFPCAAEPCGVSGVYGTLGTPAVGNVPGGRLGASSWVDSKGNFWLFGGQGFDANGHNWNQNDLWEFDPSTLEWTWIGGDNTSSGFGNRGTYGTLGAPATGNAPGSRYLANSWTDSSGNLWLFGGYGTDANGGDDGTGPLNDVWEFNPSSKVWSWVGGSSTVNTPGLGNPGVYGTLGVPASGNIPGGRYFAASWTDGGGHFWLFGGNGSNAAVGSGYLNDLWELNPSTNEWAWMNGSSTGFGLTGLYGTLGVPSPGNAPGGRETPAGWADGSGNIWLFGGFGTFGTGNLGYLSDFWKFDPSTKEWVWVGGSNTVPRVDGGNPGTYGTLGVPGAVNIPGSRYSSVSWTSSNGNLWLFGGAGTTDFDDLWEYQPYADPAAMPTFSVPDATYTSAQTVSISDTTPGATIYYTTNGTTPTTSSTQFTSAITVGATEAIQAIAVASGYSSSAVASATYTIDLPPPDFAVAATPGSQTVTGGQSATASISVTPANGFNSAVTFSCSGLPSGATCSFSPATVTPSGGVASTTLTVSTTTADAALHRDSRPLIPVAALAALLCCFGFRKRRWLVLVLVMSAAGLGLLTSCGGGGVGSGGGGSQSATYTITVTATSGALQHAVAISLTVN